MANIAQASPSAAPTDAPRRGTAIRRTPLERLEYAIIVSTLLLLVVLTVQPILNLVAMSLSDPSRVAGMSGLIRPLSRIHPLMIIAPPRGSPS